MRRAVIRSIIRSIVGSLARSAVIFWAVAVLSGEVEASFNLGAVEASINLGTVEASVNLGAGGSLDHVVILGPVLLLGRGRAHEVVETVEVVSKVFVLDETGIRLISIGRAKVVELDKRGVNLEFLWAAESLE